MGFINSYKHLEKLCGEILSDDRKISAYIDEMIKTPNGAFYVSSWNDDLNKLKHYRWIRNQIAHEPGCSEANMCEPADTLWLDNFYSRIMTQTDPIALYYKATNRQSTVSNKKISSSHPNNTGNTSNTYTPKPQHQPSGCALCMLIFVVIVAAVVLVLSAI